MANVKITELTAYTNPASTDVVPIVDLVSDQTKKVTIADLLENAGAGSASAAAFAFDGDSDTGMYRSAANSLAFTTGGTGRLFIDSSGDIAIGKASASAKLDVNGNVQFGDGGGFDMNINGTRHQFSLGGSEKMRIDSSGRLLIGTITEGDSSADNLTIADSGHCGITIRSGTSNNGTIYFSDATSGAGEADGYIYYSQGSQFLAFGAAQSERMRIDSSGNLGLGLTSLSTTGFNRAIRVKSTTGNAAVFVESPSADSWIGVAGGTGTGDSAAVVYPSTGNLRFGTTTGIGSSGWSEKIRITNDGKFGIGDASPDALLVIKGNSDANTTPSIRLKDGTDTREAWITNAAGDLILSNGGNDNVPHCYLKMFDGNVMTFATANSERMRIDNSGRLLVKTSSARTDFFNSSSIVPYAQFESNDANAGRAVSFVLNANSIAQPFFVFGKSRGTTNGSTTVVQNNDILGAFSFQGADGTDFAEAARVQCEVDGTPGSNDMPGRLVFSTSADGASTPTERMRITSAGRVGINETSPDYRLHTKETTTADNYAFIENTTTGNAGVRIKNSSADYLLLASSSALRFYNVGTSSESARIDSSGKFGIGTTSPDALLNLESTTSASLQIKNTQNSTPSVPHIELLNNDNKGLDITINRSGVDSRVKFAADTAISVDTNGSERLRLDSSGRLLVGTSSASGDSLLQVEGPIQTGSFKMASHSRAYTASTSATDIFNVQMAGGHGSAEFTWTFQDANYANGVRMGKIYLVYRGSGSNISHVNIASTTEASITNGTVTTITWSASVLDGSNITLEATGSTTSGTGTMYIYGVSHTFDSLTPITDA